ncbi:hypothetical protein [Sphaerisporangium aureirubrum]|uniref:DUF418 domain-containing protein n=1 Tax=Sphaerisporangium aureirubrum TaxID=1544736 RepID=A0ABW1NCF1_9ACTN
MQQLFGISGVIGLVVAGLLLFVLFRRGHLDDVRLPAWAGARLDRWLARGKRGRR